MNRTNNRALTLTELLLAASLMGLVVITAVNLEMASRGYHFSSDREGRLQVQLSIAMEHMVKNISLVHSDLQRDGTEPGIDIIPPPTNIVFRVDQRSGGVFTPQNYDDDLWMSYWQVGNQLVFCANWNKGSSSCNSPQEVICNNVTTVQFIPHFSPTEFYLEIILSGIDTGIPTITFHSRVFPRSYSVR